MNKGLQKFPQNDENLIKYYVFPKCIQNSYTLEYFCVLKKFPEIYLENLHIFANF